MHSPSASGGDGTVDTAQFLAFISHAYWGTVVSTVLFGVSLCQGYIYYSTYDDGVILKGYVAFLLLLDVFSTVAWTAGLHYVLILNWGTPVFPPETTPFSATESVSTLIVTFLTQMFYIHRVYILGYNRRTTPITIFTFALLSFVAGLARVGLQSTNTLSIIATRKFKIVNGFENGFAALSDVVATVAMCCHFFETAMVSSRMTSLLRRLMLYTLNRGIVVTLVQILLLALYLHAPLGLTWVPFRRCIGKLYINTFLAMLNSRRRLRSYASFSNRNESTSNSSTLVIQPKVDSADEGPLPS
ncbi:hypothetical protein BD410DRAFT_789508 [Rickenella mellea]|uniref:DUF6534 domain-containing protein n=1 Tax=Rickenella mellea TaxID=50990 RepID=A0A4Y7Q272_9AGAM|nr:hypothetical protein BD410DRAFT_789508 [Rickenella mellea]